MKLAVMLILLAGCDRRETTCAGSGEIPGAAHFKECSDKRTRSIECTGDDKDGWECACVVNGKLGRSFHHEKEHIDVGEDPARAFEVANRRCYWELARKK